MTPYPSSSPISTPKTSRPRPIRLPDRRRVAYALCVLLAVLLVLVLPPLLNVNRFRRQTAGSIAASLGRPVHMDSLTLSLLPLPALTLTNFVVSEDPAFGSEPVLRANSVRATFRWSSLWRRRVEFSRISLDETSLNLVQRSDGRWNIESIPSSRPPISRPPPLPSSTSAPHPASPTSKPPTPASTSSAAWKSYPSPSPTPSSPSGSPSLNSGSSASKAPPHPHRQLPR